MSPANPDIPKAIEDQGVEYGVICKGQDLPPSQAAMQMKSGSCQSSSGIHARCIDPELLAGLRCKPKQVPCSYLYDECGSDLYNQITELEEYYPFRTELAMLHQHVPDIITHIPEGSVLVELGCGSAQKTAIIQRALLSRDGPESCTFVGIDVSGDFLQQAKSNMLTACPMLRSDRVELIQATYMEGLKEARKRHPEATLCVLWLGSSVGNLNPAETLQFFKDMLDVGGPKTEVLVCTDLWKDASELHAAYCDSKGVTEAFILNGMKNAISAASCGRIVIDTDQWQYDVIVNSENHQVEMYVIAGENLTLNSTISINKGERILMEISRKFQTEQLRGLAYNSGFYFQAQWRSEKYSMQLFCAPVQACTLAWQDTDRFFERLQDWSDCPIELRRPFCFYYGHLPSFFKLRLLKHEEAGEWDLMFARGIDPDVSNPDQCHSHPAAPPTWPKKEELIHYAQQQRKASVAALKAGTYSQRLLWMSIEHERMHQETLCYMLAQQQKKDWRETHLQEDGAVLQNGMAFKEDLARWDGSLTAVDRLGHCSAAARGFVTVHAGETQLGVDINFSSGYVWDNEGPMKTPELVESFQISQSPVTIGEFREFVVTANGYTVAKYWQALHFKLLAQKQPCPSTWTLTAEGDVWVHYPEGTWNWQQVKDRPVWCSLAEAQAYCSFKGGRVMTEAEYSRAVDVDPHGNRIQMLFSGGWEHTSTKLYPFEGFKATKDYEEYSADFFDGKHYVLKGGSPYTHPCASRLSFRNFYQDIYPHAFAKFRVVAK